MTALGLRILRTLARQLGRLVLAVFGVTLFLFALSRLAGDPASLYSEPSATPEMLEATRRRLGLDQPVLVQLWDALRSAFTFRFPHSYAFSGPVEHLVLEKVLKSFTLVVTASLLALCIALVLSLLGALFPTRAVGRLALAITYATAAIPYFVLPMLMIFAFAIQLRVLPSGGDSSLAAYVIPVSALTFMGYATLTRLMRTELLDAFSSPFVETARSKGIAPSRIVVSHALPAIAPPVLAWMGIEFSILFGSLLVVEPLMNFNGIGSFLLTGVSQRDFPVVQTSVVAIAIVVTLVNALIDLLITVVDPRTGREQPGD